ncbi:MAG: universal stress protein, partial [Cyanobacteria bacterium P01_C01_bin.38]
RVAKDYQITDIVMGKRGHQIHKMGSVSQAVLKSSSIPVILIDESSCS